MFSRVILPHEGHLAWSARRLCSGDEDRAQDFVQDALVCAYKACLNGCFRENANPRAWLLRIVTNLYINDYHHKRRWEAKIDIDSLSVHKAMAEASQRAALVETPAALLLAATLDETVEQALASLPVNLRQCIILVDLEGLDYAQAAQSLGIPVGTIRSRLSRGRLRMSGLLAAYARNRRLLAQ